MLIKRAKMISLNYNANLNARFGSMCNFDLTLTDGYNKRKNSFKELTVK